MSNTRHASAGAPLHQERFMSSTEYERGLMANIVARRCEVLDDASHRALIWFLQLLSHQDGGLESVASELVNRWPDRVATEAMVDMGVKRGRRYGMDDIRTLVESADHSARCSEDKCMYRFSSAFPLKGDLNSYGDVDETYATSCTGNDLFEKCQQIAGNELGEHLNRLCLDPATRFPARLWYFHGLHESLVDYMAAWIQERRAGRVVTEIGREINDTLDFCLETGSMVLIDGLARTGKTHAVKSWCEQHPGQARYIQVPSTNDDIAFFRAIARGLGLSMGMSFKAQQLRERIEDTLQRSRLMVVFDEAHYCLPQRNTREALPSRLNWIMTACVNYGVPVALVTTPQFMRAQKRVEQKTAWTAEQFVGRIGCYKALPDSLSKRDLAAVARFQLPEGDDETIALLTKYAAGSSKYLAGIEAVVTRARFFSRRAGRDNVTASDIVRALEESVIPSNNALSTALADAGRSRRQRRETRPSEAVQGAGSPLAGQPTPGREDSARGLGNHRDNFADDADAPVARRGKDRPRVRLPV
jgi:hypothetical protein